MLGCILLGRGVGNEIKGRTENARQISALSNWVGAGASTETRALEQEKMGQEGKTALLRTREASASSETSELKSRSLYV